MKIILFFPTILALLTASLWAQNLPRQVISTAGTITESGNISLSWTVGQAGPVETVESSGFYLTQGFQQGDEWWVSINDLVVHNNDLQVFPNPSQGMFHINGTLPAGGECHYEIYNGNGKTVFQGYWDVGSTCILSADLDLSVLNTGSYFLNLTGTDAGNRYMCSKKISVIH